MSPASFAAENLHPGLWLASQVGRPRASVFASGFAALDEVLPGGGWPAGTLTELLLPHPGVGELRLLAPALVRLQREQHERCLMWFDPPALPCAWALDALGLDPAQMVVVRSRVEERLPRVAPAAAATGLRPEGSSRASSGLARAHLPRRAPGTSRSTSHSTSRTASRSSDPSLSSLWALEHALRSGHVGAVLAWLPERLPGDALRRLQLAAQGHEGPAFLLRGEEAARQASPAPLRLRLAAAAPDWLRVDVFKRRGPPPTLPLLLELAPVLGLPALVRARAGLLPARESVQPGEWAEALRPGLLETQGPEGPWGPQGQAQGSWA